MINLNAVPDCEFVSVDVTANFVEMLQDSGVKTIKVNNPVIYLDAAGGAKVMLEITSSMVDDMQYAIKAIIAANPHVVYVYKVIKEGGRFMVRIQYLLNEPEINDDY